MKYQTSKLIEDDKKRIYVVIALPDDCKNGHQDFSITGDIYNHPTIKADRFFESGGCIHDEILKHFPEFEIFIGLHLADYTGCPMYAIENGFYHLQNGFERTKPEDFTKEFCKYYRITEQQFNFLKDAENQLDYSIRLMRSEIPKRWKEEADKAIQLLENLTSEKFINSSVKTHFKAPTETEIATFNELYESGYYNQENKQKRMEEKKQKKQNTIIEKIEKDCQEKIDKAIKEKEIKLQIFKIGGELALEQTIFYNHSQEIKFNWRDYGKELTPQEIENLKTNLKLSFSVTYK